jgi:hypothetical protein
MNKTKTTNNKQMTYNCFVVTIITWNINIDMFCNTTHHHIDYGFSTLVIENMVNFLNKSEKFVPQVIIKSIQIFGIILVFGKIESFISSRNYRIFNSCESHFFLFHDTLDLYFLYKNL